MDSILDGFKQLTIVTGLPMITITKNGLTFSKNAIYKLNKTKYIDLYINYENKLFAVKAVDRKTEKSIKFVNNSNNYVRLNMIDLLQTIDEIMNWNHENHIYKIKGKFIENENVLIFDLSNAIIT